MFLFFFHVRFIMHMFFWTTGSIFKTTSSRMQGHDACQRFQAHVCRNCLDHVPCLTCSVVPFTFGTWFNHRHPGFFLGLPLHGVSLAGYSIWSCNMLQQWICTGHDAMTNKPLICLCRNRFGTRGLFGDGGEADQKQESSCGRRIQASSMHRKSKTFQPRCATEWTSRHKG